MSAGSVRAGGAYVEIFAKDSAFHRSLDNVRRRLSSIGQSVRNAGLGMVGLGAAIATPIVASARAFAQVGSELNDMSARTGVAAESLSVLKYAAEQTGTDVGGLEASLRKMQKLLFSAQSGDAGAVKALASIGLSIEQLQGLSPEEQFGKIADALSAISDPTQRAALAMAIFGKSGTAVLPMIERGSAGLAAFADEAKRLGLVMDSETASKADALGDAMDAMTASFRMAFIQIGSAVAPMLTDLARRLAATAKTVGDFISANRAAVGVVFKFAVGVTLLGGAMIGIGTALQFASASIKAFQTIALALPSLASPIIAIGAAFVAAVGIGIAAARQLSPAFKAETDAIWASVMRLDFSSAWQIMNLNFAIALTQMSAAVDGFAAFIGDKLTEGLDRFMGFFGADIITMQNAFERLGIYLKAAFDWDFALRGMDRALKEADRRAEEARKKAPTADARAAGRADARAARAAGWDATTAALREELASVKESASRVEAATAQPSVPAGHAAFIPPEDAAAAEHARASSSMGTFGSAAGIGLGREIDLLSPAKQTAANTAIAASALQSIADAGGFAPGGAASNASAASSAVEAMPGIASGVRTAAATDVAGAVSAMREAVVGAIREHIEATKQGNALLSRIANQSGGMPAFV